MFHHQANTEQELCDWQDSKKSVLSKKSTAAHVKFAQGWMKEPVGRMLWTDSSIIELSGLKLDVWTKLPT